MNKKLLLATALVFSITSAECPFSKHKSTNKLASFFFHCKRIGRCGLHAIYKKPLCGALAALGVILKRDTLCQWPLIVPSLLVSFTLTHEFVGNITSEYNLDYENDNKPIFTFTLSLIDEEEPEVIILPKSFVEPVTQEKILAKQEEAISEPVAEEQETITEEKKDVQRSAEISLAIKELLTFAQQLQKHKEKMKTKCTQVPNPEKPEADEDTKDIVEVLISPRAVEVAS